MTNYFYTLGYAQWSIIDVEYQIDALEAVLTDVRQTPHTTKPGFTKSGLQARFADRYRHLSAFGNVNYKEAPIERANPDKGLRMIRKLNTASVVMCSCQHPKRCPRRTDARFRAERLGETIDHLRTPRERAQPGLFHNGSYP